MKTLVLVLAMVFVISSASFAATATVDTYSGWNWISIPIVPYNSGVTSVFTGYNLMFGATLVRYDATTASNVVFNYFAPAAFGNILLGDGYEFNYSTPGTINVTGVPSGVPDSLSNQTDMWVSLPGVQSDGADAGGWHLIGTPYDTDVAITQFSGANILFTDGNEVKTWSQAFSAGWVADIAFWFDAVTDSVKTTGYFFKNDNAFRADKGYKIKTNKDNLAVIFPAP